MPDMAPKRRMNAYYYSFTLTGVDAIDAILEAVAIAGKACHHTEGWEEYDLVFPIQDAANNAARLLLDRAACAPLVQGDDQ